jgi:endonuclease YncB( thermonuclease family)
MWTVPATVLRVVDADTLWLRLDLGWRIYRDENCRIAGIDAPEKNTPEGRAAHRHAETLAPAGTAVTFASRVLDRYGRSLGAVTLPDGRDFAAVMLADGHARPYH